MNDLPRKALPSLLLALALLLASCGQAAEDSTKPETTPTQTTASKPSTEREPGSAFVWEPPDAEGSTQLELPEFPGVVFSNEYNKVPNEYGGFSWDVCVKAISRDGEKKIFACICGHREKVADFEKRREESGANKADVQKYLESQERQEKKAGSGNTALAEQLAKWMEQSGWNDDK